MKEHLVSVILPTYKEAENIGIIIPKIFEVLKNAGLAGEVIVVDDDSPDGTAEVAAGLGRDYPVRVRVRKNERGLATAVMKGFELAGGIVCVVMDADLSHPVEILPDMVRPIINNECDATVGSRYVSGGGSHDWSLCRRFISKFSGLLARGLTELSDPTSGFMAIKRSALKGVALDPVGWKIVLEVIVKTGARFKEVPIVFSDRKNGESKLGLRVQAEYIAHLWRLYQFKFSVPYQFLKFGTVGLSGLIVDTAVLMAFVELAHFDPRIGAIIAFFSAVTSNYLLNRVWTFDAQGITRISTSFAWFVGVCLAGLCVRLGVMHLLIEFFKMGAGHRYVFASILGILAATAFNFMGSKCLAFSVGLNRKQT